MSNTFGRSDKLKSKKQIEKLFTTGQSVTVFPLKLIYLDMPFNDGSRVKTAVSVSKRNHKTAVARNRIKRLIREAFRLNKRNYFNNSSTSYAFMILYLSKEGATFELLDKRMKELLTKFTEKTSAL